MLQREGDFAASDLPPTANPTQFVLQPSCRVCGAGGLSQNTSICWDLRVKPPHAGEFRKAAILDTSYPRPKQGQIPQYFHGRCGTGLYSWLTCTRSKTYGNDDPNTLSDEAVLVSSGMFWLLQREAADGVFADAAEIKRAVVFDNVRDFGVAIGGSVLEVFDDTALRIKAEDKGIALRRGLEEFREASDHLPHKRVRKHSIENGLARRHEREPESIAAVR